MKRCCKLFEFFFSSGYLTLNWEITKFTVEDWLCGWCWMLVLLIPCQRYLLCVPWPQHTPSLTAHRPQPIRVVAGNLVAGGDHPAYSNQLACVRKQREERSPGPRMSRNLCRSASSREANWPLASRGYRSLVSFTSPVWSRRVLLLDRVRLGITLFMSHNFAAALLAPCLLAIHIVAVIASIFHWDFLTFCSVFPFHTFLVSFFVPCSNGDYACLGFQG